MNHLSHLTAFLNVVLDAPFQADCPACKNGESPEGAHECVVCKRAVHAIDGCSVAIGEEGYGQSRLCMMCSLNAGEDAVKGRMEGTPRVTTEGTAAECTTESEATEEGIDITSATSQKVLDDVDAENSRTSHETNEDSQF